MVSEEKGLQLAALKAIAQLKIGQIAHWRTELVEDTVVNAQGSLKETLASRDKMDGEALRQRLEDRLKKIQSVRKQGNVLVTDIQGHIVASSDPRRASMEPQALDTILRAVESKQGVIGDLFRCQFLPEFHLEAAAPILDDAGQAMGTVVYIADADKELFPLLQSWPLPSQTAETLMVRREGKEAVLLNPLRHSSQPPLTVRFSESGTEVPAVQAILGHTGVFEGEDYRGEPVLSVILPVPDSNWRMIAKIDRREVLRGAFLRGRLILGIVLAGLLALWLLGLLGDRVQKHHRVEQLYQEEKTLRLARERAQVILSSIGDAVITTDAAGRIDGMNPVAETLTGWTLSESAGKDLSEVFHIVNDHTREPATNPVERVLRHGIVVGLANHTSLISRQGSEHPIADSGAPIRDSDGTVVGVVLVFRDQSEERKAVSALEEAELLFRGFFDNAPIGKSMTGVDGRLLRVNPAFCTMLGYSQEEMQKLSFPSITHPEDLPESRECVRCLLAGERESWSMDKRYTARDGHLVWTHVTTRLERDRDGGPRFFLTHIEDISQRKRVEEEQRKLESIARHHQKLESIGTLASGVAHEINNPLNVIMNYGQLLLDEGGKIRL